MPKIEIGRAGNRPVRLDLEILLRTRLLVQANSGGGKSWILRRLAEQLFGKVQVFLIDREGEFATLREKYGYVLVGQGGDTPADVRSARLLAEKLLELRASAVFDLYEAFRARPGDRRAWVRTFLEGVMDAPKKCWRPLVVIVDEAHLFCPQETPKAASMAEREIISGCKEAMISLATAGRKRGFSAVWATQRLAKLDKDASAELFNRLVGMTIEDVDVDRACDLMSVSKDERPGFKLALKKLEPGNFFAFGRAISNDRILVKVGRVETTHPEPGSARHAAEPPPPPEKVKALLPQLKDLPKQVEDKAKTEADLRAEIRSLKLSITQAKLKMPRPVLAVPLPTKIVEVPVFKGQELVRVEKAMAACDRAAGSIAESVGHLRGFSDLVRRQISTIERRKRLPMVPAVCPPVPKARQATPAIHDKENGDALDKCGRAILGVLAQHDEGCLAGRLALLSGYRYSGGFRNALSALRSQRFLAGGNAEVMRITGEGRAAIDGQYEPLPEGRALAQYWLKHPSFGLAERKLLGIVLAHPDGISGPDLAAEAGYGWSGGTRNALSKLRTAGVLVGRNVEAMRPSDDLMEA